MSRDPDFSELMAAIGVRPIDERAKPAKEESTATPSYETYAPVQRLQEEPDLTEEDSALFLDAMANLGDAVPRKDEAIPEPAGRDFRRIKHRKDRKPEPDEVLDLHGMRLDPALARLQAFVTQAFTHNRKSVMVITGKGLHSKGGIGILKREVEQWIIQAGRRFVRAYAEAPRAYGGRGAFILYLREA
ncbi:Smr/MutS family protein [Sulfidibacter corallicola]|uniref:Smr/MutS family protein n=1 Tax=Sulfidibacter corallicola TaxID=2818388 RepID=A0A8A4TUC1_SULCO|nr:Smr/MutS family protein [Sulfidibacter corallicola]QTD53566.1 Smr/MutS family protein [Sulfidibacter corallicola]